MIAALFVAADGPHAQCAGVDPWDQNRDARGYTGPHAVIAHPPCERWGRYATGGPNPRAQRGAVGDDDGCFASALASARAFGGVIEHPAASKAWAHFGLTRPPSSGGWIVADTLGGYTCCVAQGNYGHAAQKQTWLYVSGVSIDALPELIWGPARDRVRLEAGYHSAAAAREDRTRPDYVPVKRLSKRERIHTPIAFRDLLISIAELVQ